MTTDTDPTREAFEAWASDNWFYISDLEDSFAIWQAATQAMKERAAKVCEQMYSEEVAAVTSEKGAGRLVGYKICATSIRALE